MRFTSFPPSPTRPPVHLDTRAQTVLLMPELVHLVFEILPNSGVVSTAMGVCTLWYLIGGKFLARLHNISLALATFFDDVPGLRRFMRKVNGIISGSFADKFFCSALDGVTWMTNPDFILEFYVDSNFSHEIQSIIALEGYTLITLISKEESFPPCAVSSIRERCYEGIMRFSRGTRRVDIILTAETPVRSVLAFRETGFMNFITWDAAYCIFARDLLFYDKSTYLRSKAPPDPYGDARACDMVTYRWLEATTAQAAVFYASVRRWIGDSRCWTVKLETDSVTYASVPPSPDGILDVSSHYSWAINSFIMSFMRMPGPVDATKRKGTARVGLWSADLHFTLLASPALLCTYVVAPDFAHQVHRYIDLRSYFEGCTWETQGARIDHLLEGMKEDRIEWDS